MAEYEFASRYEALGVPLPDPATMCRGGCQGTGVYPVRRDFPTPTAAELAAWEAAEAAAPADDGWHFIRCPACGGTGRKP
jgi:hypothetical protein